MPKKPRTNIPSLRDIPNIGPRTEGDLHRIGITRPDQLISQDALKLYDKVCRKDGVRHDPCLIDVFLAAVDYMNGAHKKGWWKYTPQRKKAQSTRS